MAETVPPREHPWAQILMLSLVVPPVIATCYYLANALSDGSATVELQYAWESQLIPFVPAMLGPYLTLYPLLVAGLAISRSRTELWRLAGALLLGTVLCATVFVLVPTDGSSSGPASGIWHDLYQELDRLDADRCAMPSLHVVLAGILWMHFGVIVRGVWRWVAHGWFALLVASTLLTYQHHVVDVVSGGCVAGVCIVLLGVGRRRTQIRFWRRLRSRRNTSSAPGPNSHSAVTAPNETPVQVPRSQ